MTKEELEARTTAPRETFDRDAWKARWPKGGSKSRVSIFNFVLVVTSRWTGEVWIWIREFESRERKITTDEAIIMGIEEATRYGLLPISGDLSCVIQIIPTR